MKHLITIEVSCKQDETPYRAVTEHGTTKGYASLRKLYDTLDWIFGKAQWVVGERRLEMF